MRTLGSLSIQFLIAIISLSHNCNAQSKLEVKFQPSDYIYTYEVKGLGTPSELYDLVIQNIAIINHSKDSVVVKDVEIIATQKDIEIQRLKIPKELLISSAQTFKTYQEQGILDYYDFQFHTSRYLKGITFSGSTSLSMEEAIVITHRTMLFQSLPDLITVVVTADDFSGKPSKGSGSLTVVNHKSKNQYNFPLKGTWVAYGAPSLISHHRWGTIQEFAFDFGKIGTNGITHSGDGSKLSDYYAYGEPVYAIGDGKVVSISDGAIESDANLKQPNETSDEYFSRIAEQQQALITKGLPNLYGNYIIVEHANGEYSNYFHLKNGSIKVALNDLVMRGQLIGALGHSGNSTEPHLHFHLSDGLDIPYSRSIPVSFENISFYPDDVKELRHIHYGQIIITKD